MGIGIMATTVETVTQKLPALSLRPSGQDQNEQQAQQPEKKEEQPYAYTHLNPHFSPATYPPLTDFEHVDPGHRALKHANPRSFLDNAESVTLLTPAFGTEIRGVNLAQLDSDGRDQIALEVARRGLVVFRNQRDFIDKGPEFYLDFGKHFGRLHIHPTSGHPEGYPEFHLVYKDANKTFNFERDDSITSTLWHSDVSYERQPPGLTTLFLVSTPSSGGDTLYASQVQTLKKLSPQFVAFLRTLKALHSGVEQAEHSRSGKRGGIVRREPVETVHPVVRRHPVTGEEALYINRQFTRRIIGLKREESDNILRFLYDHIDKAGDCQTRIKWTSYDLVLWDNRVTAHSAIVDYGDTKERRHGVRVTPQAERPIPALDGLQVDD